MSFTKLTKNVLNVSALPNKVNSQAQTLKATFDKAGVDIKDAHNDLIDELESTTASANIGALDGENASTIQAVINSVNTALANRYSKTEVDAKVSTETNDLIEDFDVNLTTGVITVTKKDGTVETFDTALEKVPATFEIVESSGNYYLKITNVDGTFTQTDITNLMNVYNFSNGTTIAFTTSGSGNEKSVTAEVRDGSITLAKLSLDVISTLEGYVASASSSASSAATSATSASNSATNANTYASSASTSADNASASEINASQSASSANNSANSASNSATTATQKSVLAQSYAEGGTGTRAGEDTNNAKYYMEQAQQAVGGDYVTHDELEAEGFAKRLLYTATIPTTGWTGSEEPYTISLPVNGLLSTDVGNVSPVYSSDYATMTAQQEAFGVICNITTSNDTLDIIASEIPSTAIPIQIEVVRG